MIRSYERQASFKYLTGRGGRFLSLSALFSLLGIAVGVAALIIASAFLNGQRDGLLNAIQGRSPHVIITAQTPQPPVPVCEPENRSSQPGTGRDRALHAGRSAAQGLLRRRSQYRRKPCAGGHQRRLFRGFGGKPWWFFPLLVP